MSNNGIEIKNIEKEKQSCTIHGSDVIATKNISFTSLSYSFGVNVALCDECVENLAIKLKEDK